MLQTRGYEIPRDVEDIIQGDVVTFTTAFSLENVRRYPNETQEFLIQDLGKTSIRSLMSDVFDKKNSSGRIIDSCLLFFAEIGSKKTISTDEMANFGKVLLHTGCTTAIIVSEENLSHVAGSKVKGLDVSSKISLQLFQDIELKYIPTDSMLGAKILRIMRKDEEIDFLERNRIEKSQLPKYSSEDPVIKYHGIPPGSIVVLQRRGIIPETCVDEEIFYRVVVKKKIESTPSAMAKRNIL
jgi:DNA-directed RNA polymerase subunit H (RpoH/RPB5)